MSSNFSTTIPTIKLVYIFSLWPLAYRAKAGRYSSLSGNNIKPAAAYANADTQKLDILQDNKK